MDTAQERGAWRHREGPNQYATAASEAWQEHTGCRVIGQEMREKFRVRAGDLVVLDEAGMASTDHIARVSQLCEEAGTKLTLSTNGRTTPCSACCNDGGPIQH